MVATDAPVRDDPAEDLTVAPFLASAARRSGHRDLLVTPLERLSYAEAERRSRDLANSMVTAGVGKGTRVGILLPNSVPWAVAWLAAARIGALTVPLSTYLQADELAGILRHSDVQVLITAADVVGHDMMGRLERALPGLAGAISPTRLCLPVVPSLRSVWSWEPTDRRWATAIDSLDRAVSSHLLDALEAAVSPSDPLAVIHTSGSTAAPKGVIHTNATLIRHAGRLVHHAHELHSDDRVYSPNPFFWVGGLTHVFLGVIHVGAAALVEDSFDAERSLRFVVRERMTVFLGQPHARAALVAAAERLAEPLVGVRMLEHPRSLGMTETAGSHVARPSPGSPSFGSPVAGVEHRIADPDTGAAQPEGTLGEIWVRGEDVCAGMLRRERHEVFDPEGWYHTGDWGWFEKGELHFAGRRTEMIKTRGMNVAPQEVEQALRDQSWVDQAVVVGLPDPDEGQLVAALVGIRPDAEPPLDVGAELKEMLSSYKIPRVVLIVGIDAIPLLGNGKFDKATAARLLDASRGTLGAASASAVITPS